MKKITLKSLLIIALAIIPMAVFAQNNSNEQAKPNNNHYWSIGFDEGATLLFGDNKPFDFKNVRPEIDVFAGYTFAKHFTIYGRITAGTLRGELDKVFKVKNSSFIGADLNLSVDLISLFLGYNPDRVFGLVPHVGFGQIQYQARSEVYGKTVKWGYDEKNGHKGKGIGGRRMAWDVPMGVRFDFNLNRKCALFLDVMTTYADSDRLDAYSTKLSKHNDWYSAALIGFRYNFRKNDPQPVAAAAPADCDACADAIKQAVKDAVEDALKNNPCNQEAMEGEEDDAEGAESMVPFKELDLTDEFIFEVGKANIKDTKGDLDKIQEVRDEIGNNQAIVKTVKVDGYASPEGNDKQNQKLSEDRAKAAESYIKNKLGDDVKDAEFETVGNGSDWEGFFKALEESNIENKAEIKDSIEKAENKTAKLNELKEKYPELKELFKPLRKAKVQFFN